MCPVRDRLSAHAAFCRPLATTSGQAREGMAMELLKRQLLRIQEQLRHLSASQRMLAGSLIVISVMMLFWWANYAGKPETEAVLDMDLSPEQVQTIKVHLKAAGIPCSVVGSRVMVATDRKDEAFVALAVAQALPQDTTDAFKDFISKTSPFSSNQLQGAMLNQARQTVLSRFLQKFPGVSTAGVLIDPTREHGPNGTMPSATVTLFLSAGRSPDRKLAEAAADMVVGAVANLSRERVRVAINGKSFDLRSREGGGGDSDEYLALRQQAEQDYERKVAKFLDFVVGRPMISVTVNPIFKTTKVRKKEVDPKNVVRGDVESETSNSDAKTAAKPAEPGMQSNAPMALTESSASEGSTTDTSRTKSLLDYGQSETETFQAGGELPPIAAAILLPRSHFIQSYKQEHSGEGDVNPQVLEDYIKAVAAKLRPSIKNTLGLTADEAVQIDAYPDPVATASADPAAASASFSLLMLGGHAKDIALGVLALASLLMVSQIVRKNAPAPVVAERPVPAPPQSLGGAEEAVGEAVDGTATLDGMEVDEDSVKAQQMLSQVSEMVNDNPDAAAALVKRWLNRS
jgi:flagellar M-ring protein FliF